MARKTSPDVPTRRQPPMKLKTNLELITEANEGNEAKNLPEIMAGLTIPYADERLTFALSITIGHFLDEISLFPSFPSVEFPVLCSGRHSRRSFPVVARKNRTSRQMITEAHKRNEAKNPPGILAGLTINQAGGSTPQHIPKSAICGDTRVWPLDSLALPQSPTDVASRACGT
jgi:hypothetical protein